MNIKTKAKIIITLIAVFIAMCLLNIGTVQAVEMTETESQEIINSIIPDTMNLDIPEIEYKKAEKLVTENIKKILNEKNIKYEEIEKISQEKSIKFTINETEFILDFDAVSPFYTDNDWSRFYTETVNINIYNEKIYNTFKNKTIQITYNNHNNYNSADEAYVKKLKIDFPKYF